MCVCLKGMTICISGVCEFHFKLHKNDSRVYFKNLPTGVALASTAAGFTCIG